MIKAKTINEICEKHLLDAVEQSRVRDLIALNDGNLTWSMLRSHLIRPSSACMRICEDLEQAGYIKQPQKGYELKRLSADRQSNFM